MSTSQINKPNKFLQQAKLGKNDWWRYLLGFILFWFVLPAIYNRLIGFLVFSPLIRQLVGTIADPSDTAEIISRFISLPLSLFSLSILFLWVKKVHDRPLKSLFTPYKNFSYRRVISGFGVYLAIIIVTGSINYLFSDCKALELTSNPDNFLFLAFLAVFFGLIPVVSSFASTGYFLQLLGLKIKRFWSLVIVYGVIVTLNSSSNAIKLYWYLKIQLQNLDTPSYLYNLPWIIIVSNLIPSLFLVAIALKDNCLELPLGIGFANNFLHYVILSPEGEIGSQLFTTTVYADPSYINITDCFNVVIQYSLFWIYFFVINKRNNSNKTDAI